MQTYHGSCHCGAVRFEADVEGGIHKVVRCNCTICRKKGALMLRVHADRFRLLAGEEALTLYQFNRKIAKHYFCGACGMHAFHRPRAAPEYYTVNVNCLDDFDLDAEKPEFFQFDGQNFEAAEAELNKTLGGK